MAQDRLKQRLTGAVALLLLGLVVWFWLLDTGEPAAPVAEETTIPPAPQIEPFQVEKPAPPPALAEAPPPPPFERSEPPARTAQQPVIDTPPPRQAPAEPASQSTPRAAPPPAAAQEFAVDDEGVPVAWVVQVASLSTVASADKLVADLQGAGFKAYREAVRSGDRTLQRVYVGPKLSRAAADSQRQAIAAQFKVQPLVVRAAP